MGDDVVDGFLAGEDRRQQYAIVTGLRLGAKDGDVIAVGRPDEQFLDRAQARHAVANDDEPLPASAPDHTRASERLFGRRCARKPFRM